MARTVQRCTKCHSEKGKTHKPFCGYRNSSTPLNDTAVYVASIESGYSGGSDTSPSPSDSGSGGCE